MPTELCDTDVVLEKFPGKGGWTYAPLPRLTVSFPTYFGMQKASGWLDAVELPTCTLMSMGRGRLFVAVNAGLRKQLGKQAGDTVRLRLYLPDEALAPAITAADVAECLADSAAALHTFQQLPAAHQEQWAAWIAAVAPDQQVLRVERAAVLLAQGQALPPARG